jgi:hypothetical protein
MCSRQFRMCRDYFTKFLPAASVLADWIISRQYTDSSKDSYGAIKAFWDDVPGKHPDMYQVVPYRANLGLMGLLQLPGIDKLVVTKRWIEWYLDHIGKDGAQPGMIRDYWYRADGTDGNPLTTDEDASDSYAATFLGLVWTYHEKGGDADFLRANKSNIRDVAQAIITLQQDDGLTWAKHSYPVKYLMDNSEVYWGLRAMTNLEQVVFTDTSQADFYSQAAEAVRQGIQNEISGQSGPGLYDHTTGLYHWNKQNGSLESSDFTKWYPDTVALIWPQLFGVTLPSHPTARKQWQAVNTHWPNWTTSILTNGQLFPSAGYAATRAGDCSHAWIHSYFVIGQATPQFAHPFSVSDAGFLLRTLLSIRQCLPIGCRWLPWLPPWLWWSLLFVGIWAIVQRLPKIWKGPIPEIPGGDGEPFPPRPKK